MRRLLFISLLINMLFPLISHGALPGFMLERMGALSGQVFVDAKPFANGMMVFFHESKGLPPELGGMRRPPDFLGRLDAEGRFAIKLAAGRYYLGVLLRGREQGVGPIRQGERNFIAVDSQGKLRLLAIADRENIDAGRIDCAPPTAIVGVTLPAFYTVTGIVRNEKGEPVKEAVVLAREKPEAPRPDYMSPRTGEDGRFELTLPAGKSFYLSARENLSASRPAPGQRIGTYGIRSDSGLAAPLLGGQGFDQPAGVHLKDKEKGNRPLTVSGSEGGKVDNVEIVMYPVPDPEAVKALLKGTPNSPKLEPQGIGVNK